MASPFCVPQPIPCIVWEWFVIATPLPHRTSRVPAHIKLLPVNVRHRAGCCGICAILCCNWSSRSNASRLASASAITSVGNIMLGFPFCKSLGNSHFATIEATK
jgi:hypothetical protein